MAIYSGFYPLKMVIFHSYVKLPEGMAFGRILIALFKYGMPCFETIALGSAVCQTFPSLNSER